MNKPCVDCVRDGVTTKRKIATTRAGKPVPGPRCASHHRARRTQTRDTAWERRLIAVYDITAEEYWAIYEFQKKVNQSRGLSGVCYICGIATGTGKKKLSVDHCHKTGIVRGLICGHDNRDVLGHSRDQIEFFERAIEYLRNPPAVAVIGERIAPIEIENLTLYEETA